MSDSKKAESSAAEDSDVIEQALRTVERRPAPPVPQVRAEPPAPQQATPAALEPTPTPTPAPAPPVAPEITVVVETSAAAGADIVESDEPGRPARVAPKKTHAPVALAAVPDSEAQQEIKKLRGDVLEARQTLRLREAELEVSQEMGRDTLAKLKDQHERTLRAIADLENYKKRVVKERDEAAKFGQEKLLRDFLPIVDNLDRALDVARSGAEFEALKAGITMTRKLLEDTFSRHGVKGFTALNQPFDPRLHEAIQTIESDAAAGTVVLEVVRGFMLNERLMRPAMVGVAKARPGAPAPSEPAAAVAEARAEGPAQSEQKTETPPAPGEVASGEKPQS